MAETPTEEHDESTLDDFLIALQKTFSRVSRSTAEVPENQARAIITGNVDFNVQLSCGLRESTLDLSEDGPISLSLSGRINTDLGVAFLEQVDNEEQVKESENAPVIQKKTKRKASTRKRK